MSNHSPIAARAQDVPPGKPAAAARPKPRTTLPARARTLGLNLLSLAVTLVVWEFASDRIASPYFPGPMAIVHAFVHLALHGDLLGHTLMQNIDASLARLLLGFGLGAVLGIPIGLLFGVKKSWYVSTRVVIEPFRFIPPIAWIPLAIIFFTGMTRYAFLIFLGAFFPIFTATMVGVGRVENIHRKVLQVYGASKFYILLHAVVPSVLPDILAGMRVGLGTAWMTIVAAELTGGSSLGLGRMMVNYSEILQIPEVVVAMILIGFLGFAFNEVILLAEKRLFRWRWQVSL